MKKTPMLLSFLLLVLFGLESFGQIPQKTTNTADKFFDIKIEDLLKSKKTVGLSQIATNVEYIKLETTNECLLYSMAKYYFSDSIIFVTNKDHILKFNYNGKYLGKILKVGRGPDEIFCMIKTACYSEK